MTRRSPHSSPALEPIDVAMLASVTGGMFLSSTTLDPVLLQGIEQLAQAIMSVGQNLAAAKQSSSQQLMQLVQQLMQGRGGG